MAREKKVKKNKKKLFASITGAMVFLTIVVYIVFSLYYVTHFFPGTQINGFDFSDKSVREAEAFFEIQIEEYSLSIKDKDGKQEFITGEEILLVYEENREIEEILSKQDAFLWPMAYFRKNSSSVTIDLSYDKTKLEQKINSLNAISQEQIPAESAYPEFDGTQFVVHPETYGTAVKKDVLKKVIVTAVNELDTDINLAQNGCYEKPKHTSTSKEVTQACEEMNQLCQASITYTMDEPVVVDASVISTWLNVDADMEVTIDENAIKKWLEEFGNKYDTQGTTRTFTTPNGKRATVTGGTYGWSIDEKSEFTIILNAVKNGEVLTKEAEYYNSGRAATHSMPDWGDTYAEVDLSQQHMWYVENGVVVLETDVVTGEPIPERITPEGVYTILEKIPNKILVGEKNPVTGKPEYDTFVNYWMRVTWTGIGFHDATWQSAFGGTRNQIHGIGSHGCINMPLDHAGNLYSMIEVGTPVIIHY